MVLIDVLKKIGAGIKFVALKVRDGFVAIFGSEVAENFGKASLEMLKTEAGKMALKAVAAAQTLAVGAEEKRAAALADILAQAKESGLSLKASWINLLIEIAVSYMKGTFKPLEEPEAPAEAPTE